MRFAFLLLGAFGAVLALTSSALSAEPEGLRALDGECGTPRRFEFKREGN